MSVNAISAAEVTKSIRSIPKATAAGGSSISATPLREMMEVPVYYTSSPLILTLAHLCSSFVQGKISPEIKPWFAGAPLTAVNNHQWGISPISVEETLRRMISTIMMSRLAGYARTYLAPLQVRVSVSGGCESVVHACPRFTSQCKSDSSYDLL